jgi:hypothetical protein
VQNFHKTHIKIKIKKEMNIMGNIESSEDLFEKKHAQLIKRHETAPLKHHGEITWFYVLGTYALLTNPSQWDALCKIPGLCFAANNSSCTHIKCSFLRHSRYGDQISTLWDRPSTEKKAPKKRKLEAIQEAPKEEPMIVTALKEPSSVTTTTTFEQNLNDEYSYYLRVGCFINYLGELVLSNLTISANSFVVYPLNGVFADDPASYSTSYGFLDYYFTHNQVTIKNNCSNIFFKDRLVIKLDFISSVSLFREAIKFICISIDNFRNSTHAIRNNTETFYRSLFELHGGGELEDFPWFFEESSPVKSDKNWWLEYDRFDHIGDIDDKKNPKSLFLKSIDKKDDPTHVLNKDRCFVFYLPENVELKMFHTLIEKNNTDPDFLSTSIRWIATFDEILFAKNFGIHLGSLKLGTPRDRNAITTCIPLLIKPNGTSSKGFKIIVDKLKNMVASISFKSIHVGDSNLPLLRALYPNCEDRPYGKDWFSYLTSNYIIVFHVNIDNRFNIKHVRKACLDARIESKIPWTRNIIHCPADQQEIDDYLNYIDTFSTE